ncbi:MAG: hypothetical protein AABX03_03160, partial [Nanoarchaeota archaeon]
MKIIYTNISPINNAYTNLNHIFYLKKHNPQKVYVCVWDSFVYEHPLFEKSLDNTTNKEQKLKENVLILEKLMSSLKIDYKIIYLSEATNRLFRNSQYLLQFHGILSNIKVEELKMGFGLEYVPFGKISLSKLNYIIADCLIATYLPELFPEICSSAPNYYLTSERFKAFENNINTYLKTNFSKHIPPKRIFVKGVPVIMHPEKELIPSLEMSIDSISHIVKSHYTKKPDAREFSDLIEMLSSILGEFELKDKKIKKVKLERMYNRLNYEAFIEVISKNLYNYFIKIIEITSKIDIQKR